jgi:hypothetical protein
MVPIANPLVLAKEIEVKEVTTILFRKENLCYVVEKKSSTPQVPFGDCFTSCMRFCICWQDHGICNLRISIGIIFLKSTMLKSLIRPEALKGISESVSLIHRRLLKVFPKKIMMEVKGNEKEPVSVLEIPTSSMSLRESPSILTFPTEPVSFDSLKHLGKVELDVILVCSAFNIFDLLFGPNSLGFWKELDQISGDYGMRFQKSRFLIDLCV